MALPLPGPSHVVGSKWQLINLVNCPDYNGLVVTLVDLVLIAENKYAAIVRTHDQKMLKVRFENLEARERSTTMQSKVMCVQPRGDLLQQALDMVGLKSK